ncbi:MAG: NUDIX hydrolase [Acidobacteria bacterium]|nr:NUDIX hydrolase [Acidobacteriota bacterium]
MKESSGATLASRTLHAGRVFTIVSDRVRLPNGRETKLEVVRHQPSVILIPMPDPDHVVLVRQYRYAIGHWIWELPAGTLEPGEDMETAARRECEEEVGLSPAHLERVGAFYPTPGYCDELMVFFRLTGLGAPRAPAHQDDDEVLEPRTFTLDEARRLVAAGGVMDMKTVLGLQLV